MSGLDQREKKFRRPAGVMMRISGYIPCFNNAGTIVAAAESLRSQTRKPDEVFVVDDGSTDGSAEKLEAAGFRVVRLGANLGRGAARARAFEEAKGEWIVSCDATLTMAPNFIELAEAHLQEDRIAAVIGHVVDPNPTGALRRWRARHLLRLDRTVRPIRCKRLSTWGVVMRRDAVAAAGGFDKNLRHSEDAELGERMVKAGWEFFFQPGANLYPQNANTIGQLLERFWRWNVGRDENLTLHSYWKQVLYSVRGMAALDIRAGDPLAAIISLLTPHYFLWRLLRKSKR